MKKYTWSHTNFIGRIRSRQLTKEGELKYPIPKSTKAVSETLLQVYEKVIGKYERKYMPTQPNMAAAYRNKNRYCRNPYPEQNLHPMVQAAFVHAVDNVYNRYQHFLSGSKSMPVEDVIDQLDLAKSTGAVWREIFRTKRDFLKSTSIPFGPRKGIEWRPLDVLEAYDKSLTSDSTAFYVFWLDKLKDEIRPCNKLRCSECMEHLDRPVCEQCPNKIRTFNCASIENVVSMNKLCLDLNQNFYEMGATGLTWSTVGSSKYLGGWHRDILRHLNVGQKNSFGLDGGQWDARMFAILLWAVQELRQRWSFLTKDERIRLRTLYRLLINRFVLGEWGDILQFFLGNPSGSSNTISDNTFGFSILWEWVWIVLVNAENRKREMFKQSAVPTTQSYMDEHVCLSICGDDVRLTISDEIMPWFNLPAIINTMGSWGTLLEYESLEPKHAAEVVFVSNSSEKLGHMYLPSPNYDRVIGCLIEASSSVPYKTFDVDPRWVLLRLYAIRMDSWGNPKLRKEISTLIMHYQATYRDIITSTPDEEIIYNGVTWRSIKAVYKGDAELIWLYTGMESEGVVHMKESFPFIFHSMSKMSEENKIIRKLLISYQDQNPEMADEFSPSSNHKGDGPYCPVCGLPKPEGHGCCVVSPYELNMILCPKCNVKCSGPANFEQHCKGKTHLAKIAVEQKEEIESCDSLIVQFLQDVDQSNRKMLEMLQRLSSELVSPSERKMIMENAAMHRTFINRESEKIRNYFKKKTVRYGEADNPGPPGESFRKKFHRRKWYDPVRIVGELVGADRDYSKTTSGRRFIDSLPVVGQIADIVSPIPHAEPDMIDEFRGRDESKRRKRHAVEFQEKDLMDPDLADEFSPSANHKGDGPPKFNTGKSPAAKRGSKVTLKKAVTMKKAVRAVKKQIQKVAKKSRKKGNSRTVAVRTIPTSTQLKSRSTGGWRVTGTAYMGELESTSSTPTQFGTILYQSNNPIGSGDKTLNYLDINPYSVGLYLAAAGAASKVQTFADFFEQFQMTLTWRWKHSCADTQPGQFAVFHDKDPADTQDTYLGTEQIMQMATDDRGKLFPYARDMSYTVKTGKLWCRQARNADIRKSSGGHLFMINTTKPTYLGTTCLGTMTVDYDIRFFSPCANEMVYDCEYTVLVTMGALDTVLPLTNWSSTAQRSDIITPAVLAATNPVGVSANDTSKSIILNHSFTTPMPTYIAFDGYMTPHCKSLEIAVFKNGVYAPDHVQINVDSDGVSDSISTVISGVVFIPANSPPDSWTMQVNAKSSGPGDSGGSWWFSKSIYYASDWQPDFGKTIAPRRTLFDDDDVKEEKFSTTCNASEPESWDHAELETAVERAVARVVALKANWNDTPSSSSSLSKKEQNPITKTGGGL